MVSYHMPVQCRMGHHPGHNNACFLTQTNRGDVRPELHTLGTNETGEQDFKN